MSDPFCWRFKVLLAATLTAGAAHSASQAEFDKAMSYDRKKDLYARVIAELMADTQRAC